MTDNNPTAPRPVFPKRAVVTAGMPYGNKSLHFGHIGGVFIQSDIFARFLRDRLGDENVIYVSGTDCYGATIETGYEQALADGFVGTLREYVDGNHQNQKETLENYQVKLNLYGASALGEAGKIHSELSADIFTRLHSNGKLKVEQTLQFYDEEKQTFLNGRQVTGRCPIQGCKSEIAYADECSLGHQYNPSELINPISILSGKAPAQVAVKNWFFDLPSYADEMEKVLALWDENPSARKSLIKIIREFLKKPSVYVKKELMDDVKAIVGMPPFTVAEEEQKASSALVFDDLDAREKGVAILAQNGIRYRTGKTLVPFRLSGNVNWGISVPEADGISGLTFWVWPESLWAPISFTKTHLGDGVGGKEWEKWWKSDDASVYQFIGEDNIYFYGIAEMGLLLALDEGFKLPLIVPNHHLLYGKKKASSSGEVKPPKAAELLDYYTAEQLRLHFLNASLSERSVGFEPKAIVDKDNKNSGFDSVLYEGNLVTNVFNRLVRSCFYTIQKYNGGVYPSDVKISESIKVSSDEVILKYERMMSEFAFDNVFELLNIFLRDANKDWSARSKSEDKADINQLLADMFHVIRVAAALFHPIVPEGCEMIREYLNVNDRIWDWRYIFDAFDTFIGENHKFTFLEPRVDFFKKHQSQIDG